MGFLKNAFKKEWSSAEIDKLKADTTISLTQDLYSALFNKTDDIDAYLLQRQSIYDNMQKLIAMQKKRPGMFRSNTPAKAWEKMQGEVPECERRFIERYIIAIEKKLLNYKTPKGKANNLNNMIERFMYNAGEFLPETVDYFKELAAIHFDINI